MVEIKQIVKKETIENLDTLDTIFSLLPNEIISIPTNVKISSDHESIYLSWDENENVDGFLVKRNNQYITNQVINDNSYIDSGEPGFPLQLDTLYSYQIYSIKTNKLSNPFTINGLLTPIAGTIINISTTLGTSITVPENGEYTFIISNQSNSNANLVFSINIEDKMWLTKVVPSKGKLEPGQYKQIKLISNTNKLTFSDFFLSSTYIYINSNSTNQQNSLRTKVSLPSGFQIPQPPIQQVPLPEQGQVMITSQLENNIVYYRGDTLHITWITDTGEPFNVNISISRPDNSQTMPVTNNISSDLLQFDWVIPEVIFPGTIIGEYRIKIAKVGTTDWSYSSIFTISETTLTVTNPIFSGQTPSYTLNNDTINVTWEYENLSENISPSVKIELWRKISISTLEVFQSPLGASNLPTIYTFFVQNLANNILELNYEYQLPLNFPSTPVNSVVPLNATQVVDYDNYFIKVINEQNNTLNHWSTQFEIIFPTDNTQIQFCDYDQATNIYTPLVDFTPNSGGIAPIYWVYRLPANIDPVFTVLLVRQHDEYEGETITNTIEESFPLTYNATPLSNNNSVVLFNWNTLQSYNSNQYIPIAPNGTQYRYFLAIHTNKSQPNGLYYLNMFSQTFNCPYLENP